MIKEVWIKNIGNGRWCWVWDIDPSMKEGRSAMVVTGIDKDGRFTTTGWMKWMYAEPMTREEINAYCKDD